MLLLSGLVYDLDLGAVLMAHLMIELVSTILRRTLPLCELSAGMFIIN